MPISSIRLGCEGLAQLWPDVPPQLDLFGSPEKVTEACGVVHHFESQRAVPSGNVATSAIVEPDEAQEELTPHESQLWMQLDEAWTDEEILALQDGMLVDQLRLLADERTTAALRADLIAWIAAPMRNLEQLKHAPFSFQACCAACGVDFEEMRERTLAMFAPHLIDALD